MLLDVTVYHAVYMVNMWCFNNQHSAARYRGPARRPAAWRSAPLTGSVRERIVAVMSLLSDGISALCMRVWSYHNTSSACRVYMSCIARYFGLRARNQQLVMWWYISCGCLIIDVSFPAHNSTLAGLGHMSSVGRSQWARDPRHATLQLSPRGAAAPHAMQGPTPSAHRP